MAAARHRPGKKSKSCCAIRTRMAPRWARGPWLALQEPAMNERDIFIAARDKTDPAARSAYLAQACGGDAALRRRVEGLLRASARAGDFLETPAAEQIAADAGVSDVPTEGT